jgi:acyl dehydratase
MKSGIAGRPLYFEDYEIGMTFETPGRTITDADIVNFAGISGDFYGIHVDDVFAKNNSIFGGRVAHGLLVISVITGLWFRLGIFEGTLLAFYGIDRLRWTKPVRPGDTIRAKLTVVSKEEKRLGGLITFKNEVYNQKGELVAVFDAKLLISRKIKNDALSRKD